MNLQHAIPAGVAVALLLLLLLRRLLLCCFTGVLQGTARD
jgi:hypothetical protein